MKQIIADIDKRKSPFIIEFEETKKGALVSIINWYIDLGKQNLIKIFLGVIPIVMQNSPDAIVSNLEKWLNLLGFHSFPDFMHTAMFVEVSTWGLRLLSFCCFASLFFSFYKARKERRIPMMEAVDIIKAHPSYSLIKNDLPEPSFGFILSQKGDNIPAKTLELILFILEQSQNERISLFGKQKHLSEEKISVWNILPNHLSFDCQDLPILLQRNNNPFYTDLRVDKLELLNLIKGKSKHS